MSNLSPSLTQMPTAEPVSNVTVIKARRGLQAVNWRALWRSRDLWLVLALRDLQVRYKQTILGVAWAVLQPVAMMVVASAVIGQLLGVAQKVDGPYPVFVYAGLVPWTLFAASVTSCANSLVNNAEMLRKVYFPRLIIPLSAIGAPLADFTAAFVVLLGLMLWFGAGFSMQLVLLPLLAISVTLAALGVGILLASLTVTYRDFRLIVPFMLQLWFFLTPVIYPLPVSSKWAWLLNINPMNGVIEAFRAAVLGQPINVGGWLTSVCVAILLLMIGLAYFARTERRFADIV